MYRWTIEVSRSGQLESLDRIAPDADYCINWSFFGRDTGKNEYGRVQNGKEILQTSSQEFPIVSFVDGKLREGEFPEAYPGFSRRGVVVRDGKAVVDYAAAGTHNIKDSRSALGQLKNGNIVFITVEGDNTKGKGMTCKELGEFAVSLGCTFACDCDGGESTDCRTKDGYIYSQGQVTTGAMVLRKKSLLEMCLPKVGCGYAWGAQGQILTIKLLETLVKTHGRSKYYFPNYSAEKWLGKQVFDCSGLIVWAANKLGLFKGDYTAAGLFGLCDTVQSPMAGDLCFNAELTHVGIYAGDNKYLHAKGTKEGVVITGKYIFVKFGRLKGDGGVDWNEKNREFVMKFQQAAGLEADGLAGEQTNAKLDELLKNNCDSQEIKAAWKKFKEVIEK